MSSWAEYKKKREEEKKTAWQQYKERRQQELQDSNKEERIATKMEEIWNDNNEDKINPILRPGAIATKTLPQTEKEEKSILDIQKEDKKIQNSGLTADNLSGLDKTTQNILLRKMNSTSSTAARQLQRDITSKETEQYSQKRAEQINNDMSNGNYMSAIGHILLGVPQKAIDTTKTTFASLGSMTNDIQIPRFGGSNIKINGDDVLKLNKIETKQYEDISSKIDNDVVKTASGISGTIGQMIPSMIANTVAPGSGVYMQGLNVGAEAYQDTLKDDLSNKTQATITGIAKGITSALVEKISGGNIIGKGSLDDTAAKVIEKNFKGKIGQKLASKAYEMIGEIGEENLENQLGYVIDKLVNNKEMPDAAAWWNEASETTKSTFLTTLVLNVLGLGGSTYNDVQDIKTEKFLNEAKNIIRTDLNNNSNLDINERINKLNEVNNINNISDYNNYKSNEQKRNLIQQINQDTNLDVDNKVELLNKLNKIENSEQFSKFLTENNNSLKKLSSYKELEQSNLQRQQSILQNSKIAQNQTSEQISNLMNNKAAPLQNFEYIKSDNAKIDTLRQDANKFFINNEKAKNYVNMLEKIITDKDVTIRLDPNLKDSNGNIANGSYKDGVITINPNSTRAGEFIAIHELTHAIGTKEMINIVNNYRNSNVEFDTAVKKLLKNYDGTEISEEALSDVAGQLFGNQEFINNLAQNNPGMFRKIYNEIKYLWHQFAGYKNQNQFIEDLQYKWEQAYRSNKKLNDTSKYHVSENLSNDIDNVINNINERNPVRLRDYTPSQLVESGIKDLPVYENPSHIRKNILTEDEARKIGLKVSNKEHYHGLGKETYIKAIDSLDDPRVIFKNKNNPNEFLILTIIKDSNNNNIIVPIEVETDTYVNNVKIDINRAKSVYGYDRKNPSLDEYIKYNIKNNNLEKIYEKKKPSTNITSQSASNNSIASIDTNVNTNTKYSIQESENNSGSFNLPKVKDGYTRLYRGINEEYNSNYDRNKLDNNNRYESWTDNYDLAKSYGDNVYYIDIPTNEIKNSIIDEDSNSETYGDRNLIYENDKPVGINGKSGKEYMLYTDHDNYGNLQYNKVENISTKDNQGRKLSKEQQKYFKDSKARNENGELETVYHGSNKAGFTEFNRNFNYFTNNKDMAQSYTRGNEMVDTRKLESISDAKSWLKGITDEAYIEKTSVYDEYGEKILSYDSEEELLRNLKKDIQKEIGDTEAGGIYEGYVNIENPVIVNANGDKWSMIGIDGISINGIDDINKFLNDYGCSTWKEKGKVRTSTNDIVIAVMDAVEDGNINADGVIIKDVYDEGGYGSTSPKERGTDYITFNSNQFKATDNINPTTDKDIRYSKENETWQEYLESNFESEGTRTNLSDIANNQNTLYNNNESESDNYDTRRSDTKNVYREIPTKTQEEWNRRSKEIESTKEFVDAKNEIRQVISEKIKNNLGFDDDSINDIYSKIQNKENLTEDDIYAAFDNHRQIAFDVDSDIIDSVNNIKKYFREIRINVNDLKKGITDYAQFRKNVFGKMRLVNDNNALEIDQVYKEAVERFPGFFDEEITNPEEQLLTIANWLNYDSKELTKAPTYELTNNDLEDIVNDIIDANSMLNNIKDTLIENSYKSSFPIDKDNEINLPTAADIERLEKNNKEAELPKTKQELLDNNSKTINQYIQEKNNSTRNIESQINEYNKKLNSIQDKSSVEANKIKAKLIELNKKQSDVEALYNKRIEKAIEKGQKILSKPDMSGRKAVIQKNRELARERIENIRNWKDKSNGIKYQRETMERNMFDIIPNKQEAQKMIDTYFEPIHESEANKQRFINTYNNKIKELNLNKYESEAVQLLGEQKYNPDFKSDDVKPVLDRVNENIEKGKIDRTKVDRAIETFRNIYDELFELENQALKENGYPEKPYRKGYFPHFIDAKPVNNFEKVLEKFGFKVDKRPLPTDIAGLTEQFVPGKTWNRSALRRKTDSTSYNALKGFDTYISQAADNIYHTENIQKLRALENEIRYQYSDEGVQARIDEIYNNDTLTQDEQQAAIEKVFEQIDNPMPNLVVELRRYTNALANKKSEADRSAEQKYGRQIYSTVNAIENRFGANAVGLNIGSAITNFIPITQAYSQVSTKNMGRAVIDTIKSYINDDGFTDSSNFLTNRLNQSEKLYKTSLEKISDKTSFLFNAIDNVASNIVVRGKYLQNLDEGMNVQEAIKNADRFGANLMADRSKGAMPTLFNEKSPLTKAFTQFQLEVNNQYSYMFKDMPRDLKDKGIANLALAFFKMFIAAFFYNKASEEIVGRKSAFSPIDIAVDSYKTLSDENTSTADKVINVGKDIAEELPFVGGFLGGGRIPVSGALPDGENTFKAATGLVTGEMDSKKALNTLGKELSKPAYYLLPPFGGGQLKKTVEGVSTVANGGSYGVDSKGNDTLQFSVEDANAGDYIKAGLFGKYALDNAKEYANRGYKSLNAKQTQIYKEANIPYKELLDYIDQKLTKKEDKISYIEGQDLNENQKWGIYKYDILSNTERKDGGSQLSDAEYMINNGMTKQEYIDMYNKAQKNNIDIPTADEYKNLQKKGININSYIDYKSEIKSQTNKKRERGELKENQSLKDADKISILLNSNYSNKEIKAIYEEDIKASNDTKYDIISKSGINIKEYLKYKQQDFNSNKAKTYEYVNNMNITYNQKLLLLGMQYSLTNEEKAKLANYVNSLNINKQEKMSIYEKLKGFTTYSNGTIKW